eukprot:445904_1
MGSDFSLDIDRCYPIVQHSPYWTICIGFITSTIIQLMTYLSGHGILSWLKSCIKCKCCRNKVYDLSKTNNWQSFPEIIQITSVNPFKSNNEASGIYGTHLLHYDDENKPYYKSRTPTSENQKFYQLKYIKHEQLKYTGWTLVVNTEEKYKFDMIQTDLSDNTTENQNDPNQLELGLLTDAERDITDEKHGEIALQALDKKRHTFKLFPKTKYILNDTFWKNNVRKTNFELRQRAWDIKYGDKKNKKKKSDTDKKEETVEKIKQSDFNINEHWIHFKGFQKYIHNVWKTETLNVNGKFVLKNINDDTYKADGMKDDTDVSVIFNFVHSTNNALTLRYKMKYRGRKKRLKLSSRKITIKHSDLGILVEINNTKGFIFKVYQHKYIKEMDIILRMESVSKSSFYRGEIITFVLTLMIFWQYIHDLIFFIKFFNLADTQQAESGSWFIVSVWPEYGVNNWTRYECYGYILTNSANMKQYIVFFLCWACCGGSFLTRKYTLSGKIFLGFIILHFVLLTPIFLTHFLVYWFVYIWVLVLVIFVVGLVILCVEWISKKIHFRIISAKSGYMILTSLAIPTYILLVLFPVSTMSRYYSTGGYMDSLVSVFNDRHTSEYVNDLQHKYFAIQQFFVWIY